TRSPRAQGRRTEMSQREAAERARQEALEAAQAKPLHPAVKMGPPIIAFIVAAIAAIALIVQIAGASGHREDVAHRADEPKTQAQTAEAEARESHSEMVSSAVGTDMVRLDTDASALESLLLESGTVTMGEDVDPADVADAQAYIEESGTKDPEVETLITGIRSEEHTSELESRFDLVCRLLLAKKKTSV